MPVFNLRVAVRFDGESAKVVEQAFKDMGHKVDAYLGSVSKSVKNFERDLKGLKKLLGGALIGKVALDGGVEALKTLDRHFKILSSSGKEALASFESFANAVGRLDIGGTAAELGKMIAQMYAMARGPWGGGISQTAAQERQAAEEYARNILNARQREQFRFNEQQVDIRKIFGDPTKVVEEARKLGDQISLGLKHGMEQNSATRGAVVDMLDRLERSGATVPPELQKVASAWGVVSSASADATKKAIADSKRRTEALADEAERIKKDFEQLLSKVDPSASRELAIAEGVKVLDNAYRNGLIPTMEDYRRLVDAVKLSELEAIIPKKLAYVDTLANNIEIALGEKVDWTKAFEQADIDLSFLSVDVENAMSAAGEGFLQTWGAAVGNTVYAAFNGGDVVDAFVETLKQGLAGTLAQLFGDLAVAFGRELVKQMAAAKGANAVTGGTGNAGQYASLLKGASAFWPVLAIAAVGVAAKYFATRNDGRRYTSSAGVALTETAGLKGGYGSILGTSNSQTQRAIEAGIIDLLKAFQSATGTWIKGMETISVEIRHDKKMYKVGLETFGSMNEAIIAAAKKAFLSADLAGELDPVLRSVIESFRGDDPQKLIEGIDYVKRILNEASGLSDIDIQIKAIPESIAAVRQNLIDLGLSLSEAWQLSAKWGVQQFQQAWNSLSGQKLSPQEELAQKKASAELLVAQIKLFQVELQARKAYLEAQLKLGKIEWGGGGGPNGSGGFRRTIYNAQVAFVKGSAAVAQAEVQMKNQFLRARGQQVSAEAELWQAELDVINAALAAIDKLLATIDISKIKIGGKGGGKLGGGIGGGFGNDGSDLMTGSLSTLSPTAQLEFARQYLEEQIGKKNGDVAGARERYLEIAQKFYGNTAAYAAIFEDVMRRTSKFGSFFDQEQAARQRSTNNLLIFSNSVYKASKAMAALGGFQIAASGGGGSGSGGLAGSSLSAPSGFGGGSGGFGGVVGAIAGGADRTVDALEQVATAVRRTGGGRQRPPAPAPIPPPPPTGITPVYTGGGGGRGGRVDRVI